MSEGRFSTKDIPPEMVLELFPSDSEISSHMGSNDLTLCLDSHLFLNFCKGSDRAGVTVLPNLFSLTIVGLIFRLSVAERVYVVRQLIARSRTAENLAWAWNHMIGIGVRPQSEPTFFFPFGCATEKQFNRVADYVDKEWGLRLTWDENFRYLAVPSGGYKEVSAVQGKDATLSLNGKEIKPSETSAVAEANKSCAAHYDNIANFGGYPTLPAELKSEGDISNLGEKRRHNFKEEFISMPVPGGFVMYRNDDILMWNLHQFSRQFCTPDSKSYVRYTHDEITVDVGPAMKYVVTNLMRLVYAMKGRKFCVPSGYDAENSTQHGVIDAVISARSLPKETLRKVCETVAVSLYSSTSQYVGVIFRDEVYKKLTQEETRGRSIMPFYKDEGLRVNLPSVHRSSSTGLMRVSTPGHLFGANHDAKKR